MPHGPSKHPSQQPILTLPIIYLTFPLYDEKSEFRCTHKYQYHEYHKYNVKPTTERPLIDRTIWVFGGLPQGQLISKQDLILNGLDIDSLGFLIADTTGK